MEEWEYVERPKDQYQDIVMMEDQDRPEGNVPENHQDENQIIIKVEIKEEEEEADVWGDQLYGVMDRNPLERCPRPLYSQDCPEGNVPEKHQGGDLTNNKVETDEDEGPSPVYEGSDGGNSRRSYPRPYNRMHIVTDEVISEVEKHPCIWCREDLNYKSRVQREDAWLAISRAIVEDFDSLDASVQTSLTKDISNRWRSVKDYYMRAHNKWEKSGSSPSQESRIPYYGQLHFLRTRRCLRRTSGNFQPPQPNPPATTDPSTSEESLEEVAGSSVAREEDIPDPVSITHPPPDSQQSIQLVSDELSQPPPPTITSQNAPSSPTQPPPAQRRRRTLRITDRQFELESQAISLMQRMGGEDSGAYFAQQVASFCRQPNTRRVEQFMSVVQYLMTEYNSNQFIPDHGALISNLTQYLSSQRQPPPTNVVETRTQTDPQPPAAPPTMFPHHYH